MGLAQGPTCSRSRRPRQRYGRAYAARFGQAETFPFLDIGNEVFFLGATYDPGTLAGLDQRQVAAALARPSSPVARDIVGAANYLTAAICQVTQGRPLAVCAVKAVQTAARSLRLG